MGLPESKMQSILLSGILACIPVTSKIGQVSLISPAFSSP
jgi:hypothetical protein